MKLLKDLENVTTINITIAVSNLERPMDKGILYIDDDWMPINEVTEIRLEKRPVLPKIYPSLKN